MSLGVGERWDVHTVALVLKARTDGSPNSTSMGVEATSFSEQAPAARRDYFAGSNSGVGGGRGGLGDR